MFSDCWMRGTLAQSLEAVVITCHYLNHGDTMPCAKQAGAHSQTHTHSHTHSPPTTTNNHNKMLGPLRQSTIHVSVEPVHAAQHINQAYLKKNRTSLDLDSRCHVWRPCTMTPLHTSRRPKSQSYTLHKCALYNPQLPRPMLQWVGRTWYLCAPVSPFIVVFHTDKRHTMKLPGDLNFSSTCVPRP